MLHFLQIFVQTAHADPCIGATGPGVEAMCRTICSTLPFCNLGTDAPKFFSQRIVDFIFPLIVGAAVCVVIYAGIKMITGGEEGYTEAKTIIMYGLIGIVLAMLTGSVFVFIGSFLMPLLVG